MALQLLEAAAQARAVGGFVWVLLVLYLLPLPLIPWLYAATFERSSVAGERRSRGAEEQRGTKA